MKHKVTLIPGDGIGPEVVDAALTVIDATGVRIDFERVEAGECVMKEKGTPIPTEVLDSIRRNKVAFKGPITTPIGTGFRSVNVSIRQSLNLYANLRPAKSMKGLETRYENIDLVVIRENTEGLYSGIERYVDENTAETIRRITREASERIARFAFEYATREKREKVTAIHKANILKFTGGLFLEAASKTAEKYPKIVFEDRLVDNMCMQLVKKPEEYDVLVCTNLFGDLLSDLCAGLVGGLGVVPSGNIGDEIAVFEPVHGSAPKYAGKNKVNPIATILSSALMLDHLNERNAANRIRKAVTEVVSEGRVLTYDLGGESSTNEVGEAIAEKI